MLPTSVCYALHLKKPGWFTPINSLLPTDSLDAHNSQKTQVGRIRIILFLQRDESASPVCCLSVNLSLPEPEPNLTPGASQRLIVRGFFGQHSSKHLSAKCRTLYKAECKKCMDWIASQQLALISAVRTHLPALLLEPSSRVSPAHVTMVLVLPLSFSARAAGEKKKEGMLSQSAASTMECFCWHPFSYIVKHSISWPLLVLPSIYLSSLGQDTEVDDAFDQPTC